MIYRIKSLPPKQSKKFITEMCRRVGVDADKFDFNKCSSDRCNCGMTHWFWKYEWTRQERDDFIKWVVDNCLDFIPVNRKYRGKNERISRAEKLLMNYSWITNPN